MRVYRNVYSESILSRQIETIERNLLLHSKLVHRLNNESMCVTTATVVVVALANLPISYRTILLVRTYVYSLRVRMHFFN